MSDDEYGKKNSDAYTRIDSLPYVDAVEKPSIMEIVQPAGKTVLDYGCGSGKYTRWMRIAHAERVLGVDVSKDQLDLARAADPQGHYQQIGVSYPQDIGQFDAVISVWVVIVAENRDALRDFFRIAYDNLKPGGRYLMWTCIVPDDEAGRQRWKEAYASGEIGFEIESGSSKAEPIHTIITVGDFKATNYFYAPETYRELLAETGFTGIEIIPAESHDPDPRWAQFAHDTGMCAVVATKPR